MGMWDKRIGDVTIGDIVTGVGVAYLAKSFWDWLNSSPRREDEPAPAGLPPGHPRHLFEMEKDNPEKAKLIRELRRMKQFPRTPDGGWDQYKKYAKYLEDVRIDPRHMDMTIDWPDWMIKPPERPRDHWGDPVDPKVVPAGEED